MKTSPVNAGGSAWFRFEPPLVLEGGDLDRFLGRALPGSRVLRVEYLEGGVVNSNYRADVVLPDAPNDPVPMLIRLSRSDEGPLRSGAVAEAVHARLPCAVPRLRFSERGERPEPHRRSLFNWVAGQGLDSRGDRAGESLRAAEDLGRTLAVLHAVPLAGFGRFTVAADSGLALAGTPVVRWADEVSRRTAVRLDNPAHGLDRAAHDQVRQGFARLLAPFWTIAVPAVVVHGDLSAGNILLHRPSDGESLRLSGLIDWEMARGADPAHDFASLRFEVGRAREAFTAAVEAAYRQSPGAAALIGSAAAWEARIRLASIPILLDARMVAHRRRSPESLQEIDRALVRALERPPA